MRRWLVEGLAMAGQVRRQEQGRARNRNRLEAECDCEYAHVWFCKVEDRGAETNKLVVLSV